MRDYFFSFYDISVVIVRYFYIFYYSFLRYLGIDSWSTTFYDFFSIFVRSFAIFSIIYVFYNIFLFVISSYSAILLF